MIPEAAAVIAAGAFGYVVRTVADHLTGKDRKRQDELAEIRQSLMDKVEEANRARDAQLVEANRARDAELRELRAEVLSLRNQVDTWQEKYHDLRVELEVSRRESDSLKVELGRLRRRVRQNESDPDAGPQEGPAVLSGGAPCD